MTIAGKTYTLQVDDLELGEIEVIEDAADMPLSEINWGRANVVRAITYVLLRRENPAFTMDDARHMKLSDLGDPEPPSKANGSNGSKTAGKRPTAAPTTAAKVATDG